MSLSPKSSDRTSPPLIFVVDDHPELTQMAEMVLTGEGYRCRIFSDPEVALHAVRSSAEPPDLLLTDYDMGAINGLELIELCRRSFPDLKVLLLSGTIEAHAVLDHPVKVNRFLGKPYRPAQLVELVKSLLAEPPRI